MKNILLALLLANILYFVWGMISTEDAERGTAIVEESDLGPPLDVTSRNDGNSVASVDAALGTGEPSALQAVVGRSCITLGPFRDSTDADSAVLIYSSEGMQTALRPTRAEVFVGHWVQIRNIDDEASATAILAQLAEGGLGDAYLDRTGDDGLKISLGLFGDVERAERIELQARSLDLPAEVVASSSERDVVFVDISLPPGKGAGAIIEKYGQDRVLLREAATCP